MRYIPNTPDDRIAMLRDIGVSTFEDLLSSIPHNLRLNRPVNLPDGASEWEVRRDMTAMARKNVNATQIPSFLGAGAYDHYVPSAINAVAMRSEFVTAYTPYQPEVAQGTLQVIYEFQSMICELFAMPCANASLYDGGSALAEAVMLSRAHSKKSKIVWSDGINPNYRRVAETITSALGVTFVTGQTGGGKQTAQNLAMLIDDKTAAVVLQYPNFYGVVDDLRAIIAKAHANSALAIVVADPIAMGLLTPPGEMGADIVVGEGQSLGNYMSYGGPYLGLFATTEQLVRLMPGRVVGMTKDVDGRRGYVLTLQTREQHIRRDKATSNICTNQGLIATRATLYLSMLGPTGLRELGLSCSRRCHYLMNELAKIPGYQQLHSGPHFREFLLTVPVGAEKFCDFMIANGVLAGVPVSRLGLSDERGILVALTENRTLEEMDNYVTLARRFAKEVAV